MSNIESTQQFLPLERSNKGRQSAVCEEDFLKLIAKHAETFKSYGGILPVNHEIITEFAVTLNATRKGIHLKIKKYLELSQCFFIEKKQQIRNDDSDDHSEEENTGTVDSEYGTHQIVVLSAQEQEKIMPVMLEGKRIQMPDNWTFYIAEILWDAGVKTECAYSFVNGNIIRGELKTTASCFECGANFGICTEEHFKKINIEWFNKGNSEIIHLKKRKFTKNVKLINSKALANTSSTTYLREKASEKMKWGDVIPATIAKAGN